jgi:hypothetical protein
VYRRVRVVKRWQGGAGWVGVTDGVTLRRCDLQMDSEID